MTLSRPGVLYNGVYVMGLSFVPMAAAGKTCAHIACRRPDDHAAIFFLFRQYLGAQLRGGIPRMRSRGEWAPKGKPVPAPTVDLDVHYGSWLLLDARDAVLQRGGVVHVLAENLRIQDFRHPLLFSMYSKE